MRRQDDCGSPLPESSTLIKEIKKYLGTRRVVESAKNVVKYGDLWPRVDGSSQSDSLFLTTAQGQAFAPNESRMTLRKLFKVLF